jgi:predicted nucleotide-binding protein (sugar kinase/HSP70/actin superfamily)
VSNFSCTIDSFTQALLLSELGSKPYLMLEIDAHTADAGIQTRIEAFLDIVRSHHEGRAEPALEFTPAGLGSAGRVTNSSGAELAIDDPRVRIHFPAFSGYHDEASAMAARWLGLHAAPALRLDRAQLERGLRHTSGRECLPLPICVGQLLQIAEMRKPGEVAGMFMLRGGAPCVVDSFLGYFERFIARHRIPDLFVFSPHEDNDYCGFDLAALTRSFAPALYVADILVEIDQCLQVVGAAGSIEALRAGWRDLVAAATTRDLFDAKLGGFIERLAAIRRNRDPAACARVVVTGDFFTRFSGFFMEGVRERYARRGIILKPVDLEELVIYTIYDKLASTAQEWGLQPGYRAAIRACARVFQPDGQEYLSRWKQYQSVKIGEQLYRRKFEKTGLLVASGNDISMSFERAARHVSPAIYGEVIPTVGKGLQAAEEGYDGIILLGPFNCLPYRISESILKPICYERDMPILTCESDGYAVSPAFLRQVDVHIQQVLDRRRQRSGPSAAAAPRARS